MKVTKIKELIKNNRQNFNRNRTFQKKTNPLNSKGETSRCNFCGLKFD